VLTVPYPHISNIQDDWKGRIKFDGASRPLSGYVIRKKGFHEQIAVPYPPPHITALPIAYRLDSPLLPKDARIGNISERLTPTPRAYRITSAPSWVFPHILMQTIDRSVLIKVLTIDPASNSPLVCRRGMVRSYLNSDGDELWYVYRGNGACMTELGVLRYEAGDYLYIPKGFMYEFFADIASKTHIDTNNTILVGIESSEPLCRPSWSMSEIPYSVNDMKTSSYEECEKFQICHHECLNPYIVAVKRLHAWSFLAYSHSPLTSLGYSGSTYPFIINEEHINVPVVDTVHTDPTFFTAFVATDESAAVSVFRPRRVHSLPYHHDNTYDECLFLASDYAARGKSVSMGDMTFHPQGFCHGPQPNALASAIVRSDPKDNAWDWQSAVMFESRKPLIPSRESIAIELQDYWESWIHGS